MGGLGNLGLAGHRMEAVFENTKIYNRLSQKTEYYRNKTFLIQQGKKASKSLFPIQGIFCFGGQKSDLTVTNELKVLVLRNSDYWWYEVKAKGMPPLPRYGHSMSLYVPARVLVIYGGKDDTRNINGF